MLTDEGDAVTSKFGWPIICTNVATEGTPELFKRNSMSYPGGAMLLSGGAVTFSDAVPAVKESPTSLWSMPKEWVNAPLRTRTTVLILAASGVCTVNVLP